MFLFPSFFTISLVWGEPQTQRPRKGLAKVVRLVMGPGNGLLAQLSSETEPFFPAGHWSLWKVVAWLDLFSPPWEGESSPPPPGVTHGSRCADWPPGFLTRVAGRSGRAACAWLSLKGEGTAVFSFLFPVPVAPPALCMSSVDRL